ncbi:MAG: hypothetical protein WCX30_03635 [Candidatus Paceibacterota bacterium]|nr:hypothetical protein [bacterium]
MNKKIIFIALALLIVILIIFGVYFWQTKKSSPKIDNNIRSEIIFYYGEGCSYCENVEKYIKENKISEKISFESKEVFKNKKNTDDLVDKAEICKIDYASISVPLLFDGSKCYEGDENIIKFFKTKTE